MVKLSTNVVIAAWLFASAFFLPHSQVTAWNAMLVALFVAAVAFIAFSAVGRPGTRYFISVAAVWLFASTMILPHESLGTVLHEALIATLLAAVSLVPSKRWGTSAGHSGAMA